MPYISLSRLAKAGVDIRPFVSPSPNPAPNCVKIEVAMTWKSKALAIIFYAQGSSAATLVDLVRIAELYLTQFESWQLPLMSNDVVLVSVTVTDLSVDDGNHYTVFAGPGIVGGITEQVSKIDDAVFVTRVSDFGGRGGTGWNRYPGIPDSKATDGALTVLYQGQWQTAIDGFYLGVGADAFAPVNISFFKDNAARPVPMTYSLNGLSVASTIHHQSSRAEYRS